MATRVISLHRSLWTTKQALTSLLSRSYSSSSRACSLLSLSPFSQLRLRPLAAVTTGLHHLSQPVLGSLRTFATRQTQSSLNDSSPNWSNRPPKETILLDGCDFEHWLVVLEKPEEGMTRDDIIDWYIKTLAMVVGSEEEARMKIYSVSTRHYFAFGALVSEELSYKIKELPKVRWVLPDSYLDVKNKDYGGEPFIDGKAVPYDPKYHEEWVRNNVKAMERNRRNDRPRNYDRSRNFERRRQNMQNPDFQNPPPSMGGMPQNNMGGPPNMGGPLANNIAGMPTNTGGMPPPPNNMGGMPPPPNMGSMPPPPNNLGGMPPPPNMGGMPPNMGGMPPPPNNLGGMPPPPNMGGMPPPNNLGGMPPPPNNLGSMPPPDNLGGMPPPPNRGGTPLPPYNRGVMPPPPNNLGGVPPPNRGGMPPPPSNMGGMPPLNRGEAPPPNIGGAPSGGWSANIPNTNNMPDFQNSRGMAYPNTQMPGNSVPNYQNSGNTNQPRDLPGRDAPLPPNYQ